MNLKTKERQKKKAKQIDQTSLDLVYNFPAEQNHDIIEHIESRSGHHQLNI